MSSELDLSLPPDEDRGPALAGLSWTLTSLSLIIVGLRVYVRGYRKRNLGWDDALIVIPTMCGIFGSACITLLNRNGFPRHILYLNETQISKSLEWFTIALLENFIGLFFLRASVAVFLLRLLDRVDRRTRRFLFFVTGLNALFTVAIIILVVVSCVPLQAFWDFSVRGRCFSKEILTDIVRTCSSLGVALDFITAMLPLLIVKKLQMSRRLKAGLSVILALGFVTAACSIGRTISSKITADLIWALGPCVFWGTAELKVGIIVACAPSMKQLYEVLRNDYQAYSSRKSLVELHGSSDSIKGSEHQKSSNENTLQMVHIHSSKEDSDEQILTVV